MEKSDEKDEKCGMQSDQSKSDTAVYASLVFQHQILAQERLSRTITRMVKGSF